MTVALRFDDPARQSQRVFRAIMTAMSRPGRIETVYGLGAPAHLPGLLPGLLPGCMAGLALALCDYETPVWLDLALSETAGVAEWFRFQTGAQLVGRPRDAAFAFCSDVAFVPALAEFALGTDEYPDRSTTLVLAVDRLSNEGGASLVGPGVKGAATLGIGPLRAGFLEERAALRELFPRGLDMIVVCGDRIAALPRTTIVEV
jgi:alpha-D-ribose 1-methylphosphonate 5-triphosphate synthase subunit PhnH